MGVRDVMELDELDELDKLDELIDDEDERLVEVLEEDVDEVVDEVVEAGVDVGVDEDEEVEEDEEVVDDEEEELELGVPVVVELTADEVEELETENAEVLAVDDAEELDAGATDELPDEEVDELILEDTVDDAPEEVEEELIGDSEERVDGVEALEVDSPEELEGVGWGDELVDAEEVVPWGPGDVLLDTVPGGVGDELLGLVDVDEVVWMFPEDVLTGGNTELVDRLVTTVDEPDADGPEDVPAPDVEELVVDNVEERTVTLPVPLDSELAVDPDRLVLPPELELEGVIDKTGVTGPLVRLVGVAEEVAEGGGPAELEVATDGLLDAALFVDDDRVDTRVAVLLMLDCEVVEVKPGGTGMPLVETELLDVDEV
ncbi:hypothetical protein COL26b_005069 [Colletotrichum chrysophilum]|uniref:uncharacterized protein n=1 Tax=Colletotrichum chrysophilum TaxID=1836956 RepID=UPI002300F83F|nr:uncharacterized protein COL26b_005069 [Colletotrichum chrysophilum]KAJ0376797.1 hypothetical protein COL26b_005069 [Colletotrichum chrysophilum]